MEILALYLIYWLSQLKLKYVLEGFYHCQRQWDSTQENFIETFLYPEIQTRNWIT